MRKEIEMRHKCQLDDYILFKDGHWFLFIEVGRVEPDTIKFANEIHYCPFCGVYLSPEGREIEQIDRSVAEHLANNCTRMAYYCPISIDFNGRYFLNRAINRIKEEDNEN
jgi:hypothetical protein